MAADITLLFRASVKTVKTRNRAIGVNGEPVKEEILRKGRSRAEFTARAREVLTNISKLKDFLLEHRKDYINASSFVMSEYSNMTDMERDQIDQDAQIFMRTCSDAIHQLRAEASKNVISPQVKEHRKHVLDLLDVYLKNVCKVYSEQRAIRVKRVVDKKRLSRLEPEQRSNKTLVSSSGSIPSIKPENSEELVVKDESNDKTFPELQDNMGLWEDSKEDELSPEEIQVFEQENQRLVSEMNSLVDEVRKKRLIVFTNLLWAQPRMLRKGTKTLERQSKIMLDFVCGSSSSW
ncbi:syntaxin-18 isoform X2 [Scyliorhinus canicula]|uniref:syntaxin-18 isoform X2 n=1 Tax=Scyliorhinus canicula TaxID=7830 RepID=UPI0018F71118|nr:syntaxin-18 isoform X2 [Scyliorhinus canicula]